MYIYIRLRSLITFGRHTLNRYVDNLVDAHILAAKELASSGCIAGGNAYFISDGEPGRRWFPP